MEKVYESARNDGGDVVVLTEDDDETSWLNRDIVK